MTTCPDARVPAGPPAADGDASDALARVRRLSVTFPGGSRGAVPALDGVDLTVRSGDFVAVIGPSGCGKSTLLRAVAGLLPPGTTTGPRSVVSVATAADGHRDVAWQAQRDSLLPWRRARSNALVGARVAGRDAGWARDRADELFERFGLAGFEQAWPHELSGGMRQRLALLRTVLADRRLVLLDEPFSGLDALTRRSMNAWLGDVDLVRAASGGGGAVVLVTHDVEEAVLLADRVVVMSARPGRVLAEVPARRRDAGQVRAEVLRLLGASGVRTS